MENVVQAKFIGAFKEKIKNTRRVQKKRCKHTVSFDIQYQKRNTAIILISLTAIPPVPMIDH